MGGYVYLQFQDLYMKTIFFITLLVLISLVSSARLLAETTNTTSQKSLCKNWDAKHLSCLQCFQGCTKWQNICVKIVKHCSKWNSTGDCIQCEVGYGNMQDKPINGTCPEQTNTTIQKMGPQMMTNQTIDVNCQCHNNDRQCIDCFAGYYLDIDNFCVELPENCTAADPYGNCTSCVSGFVVQSGQCVRAPCNLDLCRTFNADQTQCASCPNRSYLQDGCCIQVNGYCSQWVITTGVCKKCYVGYVINKNNNKECIPQSQGSG